MLTRKKCYKQLRGRSGEDITAHFLRSRGYVIVERNYRNRLGEIDLIATKEDLLVFIEVKTRTSTAYGLPQEAVTLVKQKKIRRTALAYMQNKCIEDADIRFDVVGIIIDNDSGPQIHHITDAF